MCGLRGQEDHFRVLRLKKLVENDKLALVETVLNYSYIIHVPGTLTNKPKQKSSITLPAFYPPPRPPPPRTLSLPMDSPKARKQAKSRILLTFD